MVIILAQIGCFVPCQFASINVRGRIFSRLGTSDDMENNMSTFSTEMKEAAYILDNVTEDALILIDELGRGTCIVDGKYDVLELHMNLPSLHANFLVSGISLAFSVAEELMKSRAFVLFVTHFPHLTELAKTYPFARNLHMKANLQFSEGRADDRRSLSSHSGKNVCIQFLHQVSSGPCDLHIGYGIIMSELCGFPDQVVDDARFVRKQLEILFPMRSNIDNSLALDNNQFKLFKLLQKIFIFEDCADSAVSRQKLLSLKAFFSEDEMESMRYAVEEITLYSILEHSKQA